MVVARVKGQIVGSAEFLGKITEGWYTGKGFMEAMGTEGRTLSSGEELGEGWDPGKEWHEQSQESRHT